jgi:hypothetical protein
VLPTADGTVMAASAQVQDCIQKAQQEKACVARTQGAGLKQNKRAGACWIL